jgi:hypothetical protein
MKNQKATSENRLNGLGISPRPNKSERKDTSVSSRREKEVNDSNGLREFKNLSAQKENVGVKCDLNLEFKHKQVVQEKNELKKTIDILKYYIKSEQEMIKQKKMESSEKMKKKELEMIKLCVCFYFYNLNLNFRWKIKSLNKKTKILKCWFSNYFTTLKPMKI